MGLFDQRVTTIEGRKVLVVERRPPLPPTLDRLLSTMAITMRVPMRINGWRSACADDQHRLLVWIEGTYTGPDAVRRTLQLSQCADCAGVCVRDVSLDRLPGLPHVTPLMKKSGVLGWYSGARQNEREYRVMGPRL